MPRTRTVLIGLVSYSLAGFFAASLVLILLGTPLSEFVNFIAPATLLVLVFALIPFVVAMTALHAIGRTGWLAHAVTGLLAALAAQIIMSPRALLNPGNLVAGWQLAMAGAAAGLVYWALFTWLDRRIGWRS